MTERPTTPGRSDRPLPRSGPLEVFAQMRAALDKRAFLDALAGPAVLIRLDERGGDDEPAPWAFFGSGLPLPKDLQGSDDSDEDVFVDRSAEPSVLPAAPTDVTLTGPTPALSVPAALGRATLHVVPTRPVVTIGRGGTCDVRIQERSISKAHAHLHIHELDAGVRFSVADLGSNNGLAVNGTRVSGLGQLPIRSGDVVDLGDVSLLFLDSDELWDGLSRLLGG